MEKMDTNSVETIILNHTGGKLNEADCRLLANIIILSFGSYISDNFVRKKEVPEAEKLYRRVPHNTSSFAMSTKPETDYHYEEVVQEVLPINQDQKKPFIVASIRDLLDQFNKDEISFSRMVEILNETALYFFLANAEDEFADLFQRHVAFATDRFPDSTWHSSLRGLEREIKEVEIEMKASTAKDADSEKLEYVDCLMYLLDSAARAGMTMDMWKKYFRYKLMINKDRVWIKNPDNSYSHKK